MGMLPSSQYGSVALMPSLYDASQPSQRILQPSQKLYAQSEASGNNVVLSAASTKAEYLALNTNLSALSIRATEYLQRRKEVVQFSSKDYSDQMAAQFGIKAPEYMGNHAHYMARLV